MKKEHDQNGAPESRPTDARRATPDDVERMMEDAAGRLPTWRDSDEALAYYVTTVRFEGASAPESARRELESIEREARRDPDLRRRMVDIRTRLDEMAKTSDAAAHFERVTGHSLATLRADEPRRRAAANRKGPKSDAPPRPARRRRVATLALGTALTCYGLLAVISAVTRPPYLDLAYVRPDATEVGQALRLRGGETDAVAAQNLRYLYAHTLLTKARRSTLGLFTHYDRDQVQEAIDLLDEAVDHSHVSADLWRISLKLLSQAQLSIGNVAEARLSLLRLAETGGPETEEARELLAEMDTRGL